MFEIGFLELVVVGMVALVVLGPERLPGAIRTISLWIGRLRRSFNTIKQDIEREIGADEIRRQLRNEAIMDKFKQTRSQVQDTIDSVKKETAELRKSADLESQAAAFVNQNTATGSEAGKNNTSASVEPASTGAPPAPPPSAPQPATDTTKSES